MTNKLTERLDRTFDLLEQALEAYEPRLRSEAVGVVSAISRGIARVEGLPGVAYQELVRFPGGLFGLAFDLRREEIGVLLLGDEEELQAGDEVRRTLRVLDVPVGEALIGRVVDPLGRPLDRDRPVSTADRWPVERPAPAIMDRAPVQEPLQTGIKVVDALIPIGRGQRELILGDRQTGKTAIALDAIINQADEDVLCIYCAIGQRDAAVARVIDDLEAHGAMDYTLVVVAGGQDAPGLKYVAPYAATTMAEYFAEDGQDVLVVYDDLTQHARAYRELSLLLRRPPGREAYPGDIFYIHSRLLERATHFSDEMGGGSLTALPIIETQAQNISAYIPTNLISITDGQIYLDPTLFRKGVLPAVSVGRSVSRVGGKAQLPAYQAVAGDLRLSYSQFEELESFARFGTRLDEETRHTLERGRRVREVLKQPQYEPIPVAEQIAVLLATTQGVYDRLPPEKIGESNRRFRHAFRHDLPEIYESIQAGKPLEEEEQEQIISLAESTIGKMYDDNDEEFDGDD